ncbi:unnamed protein product [Owenia fusiformis]|uniref:Uncharacterized protein n=1 Tax=Owenia fusiformis TaxID=6347 RepID=A0A8J1ULD7_OWEFU|nr:unnamed protein product [Owenia fusiformis]
MRNRKRALYQDLFPFLPEQFVSCTVDGSVDIDFPTDAELEEAYQLINDAIDEEIGFGADEYPTLEYFVDVMRHDSILPFVLKERSSKKVVGFFFTAPTRFHRGVNPIYCDMNIVLHPSYRTFGYLNDFLNSVVWRYAETLGYEGFIGEHLTNDWKGLKSLVKRQGYELLGRLPCVTKLKHSGYVDSFIVMKRFNKDAQLCSQTEIRPKLVVPTPDITKIKVNSQPKKATKRRCTLLDGREIVVDYAKEDELKTIYDFFVKAQKEGDGYAVDEYPTYNHFVFKFRKSHVFTMKVADGRIVGMMSVIPSRFSRSAEPTIAAGPMYVTHEIRGKGDFPKFLLIQALLGIECGYTGSVGDTFVTNKRVVRTSGGNDGSNIIATIPRSAYAAGQGWVDSHVMGGKFLDFGFAADVENLAANMPISKL